MLLREPLALLPRPAISYGKAAIVGTSGDLEHAAAVLHPRMGKPICAAIDVPLGGKSVVLVFAQFDTLIVMVPMRRGRTRS